MAIDYATERMKSRRGEIRILDAVIPPAWVLRSVRIAIDPQTQSVPKNDVTLRVRVPSC